MNSLRFNLLLLLFVVHSFSGGFSFSGTVSGVADEGGYDICIYGSTSAGVIAAYSARKLGKTVVLISPDGHIGGLSSGGLGKTDIGNKHVITGLSRDFYRRLGKEYRRFEAWNFEPRRAHKLFEDYLKEANVPLVLNKRVTKVNKKGARIRSVELAPTYGKVAKTEKITAKVYLDCTYEGDLMAMADVATTIGREDNARYNETVNGYYLPAYKSPSGYHQFPDGVSPYKVPGDPSSGLVWGISNDAVGVQGAGDRRVQAYNFRICLTDSTENSIPITRPVDYDVEKYELMARLFAAQPDMRAIDDYFIWSKMPNRKTDINNRGGFSTDMIGWSDRWPEAGFEERKILYDAHVSYTKGMLYFMKTDPRVPENLRNYVSRWGYPKDEYTGNGNFSPQLYVREGRRMVGEYVMTEKNCRNLEKVADGIGMAAYTMDSHNCQRIVVNGSVKNEGNVEVGGFPPYPISYRSIVPRRAECTNLLVPVCLSASHIAYGSIRMEPVFMVLAQAAGVAAAMAIDAGVPVQMISVERLQQKLKEDPYLNGGIRDALIDDSAEELVKTTGKWNKEFFKSASYFSSTLVSKDKQAEVTFKVKAPRKGSYRIYYYCTGIKQLEQGSEYIFKLSHSNGVTIKNRRPATASDNWLLVDSVVLAEGKDYELNVRMKEGSSALVADALLLVPEELGYNY